MKVTAWLRSFVPINHLELICNGKVARELKLNSDGQSADIEDTISGLQSGWCLLRASSDKATYPLLDLYPYATTSPIYITVADSSPIQKEDAAYFEAWIDRMIAAAKAFQDWNNAEEKSAVLQQLTGGARGVRAFKIMNSPRLPVLVIYRSKPNHSAMSCCTILSNP